MARTSRKNIEDNPAIENKLLRTALYIRLSVEDNKKRGNSVETQIQILENYIDVTPDLTKQEVYIDNGLTGRNFDRPEFSRMMEDIEKGKIDCVVVKDLSRLGRNSIDTGYYVEKHFPLRGVRFISVTDNFDSETDLNSASGIILPLKNMINEAYSFDIAKKIKAQAEQSMRAGEYIGGRPPYGYRKAPDNCHKLIVDEESAAVVRQIFGWACQKDGLSLIVKKLNETGVETPSHYAAGKGIISHKNLIGTGDWQTRTISKILTSEVYMGDLVQGKTKSVNRKQRENEEENWITVQNTHEPIISREIFAAVQEYRRQVAVESKNKPLKSYTKNVLQGKIFCGCCGKNLHRQNVNQAKGTVYFFHCISNNRIAKGTCEGAIYFKEQDLLDAILVIIKQKSTVISGKNLFLQQHEKAIADKAVKLQKEIRIAQTELSQNQLFLKSLYENLVTGLLTLEDYKEMKQSYEQKIVELQVSHTKLIGHQSDLKMQTSDFTGLTKKLKQINRRTALTAELLDGLIEKITIYNGKDIEIAFRFENAFPLIDEVCDVE